MLFFNLFNIRSVKRCRKLASVTTPLRNLSCLMTLAKHIIWDYVIWLKFIRYVPFRWLCFFLFCLYHRYLITHLFYCVILLSYYQFFSFFAAAIINLLSWILFIIFNNRLHLVIIVNLKFFLIAWVYRNISAARWGNDFIKVMVF